MPCALVNAMMGIYLNFSEKKCIFYLGILKYQLSLYMLNPNSINTN